ncbi:hypothetical protein VN97_g6635 [Penicillium thymicola]|uniref:Uncharacterized protein n=1 Tax=Penicillium thymicola TaxID=293382 RepID=A0AAI9X7J7_PENTH|nr:hypothetical protein VN97_g6635 [Penicillium thymicola]
MLIGVCSASGHCLVNALRLAIQIREMKNGSWGTLGVRRGYAMWVKNVCGSGDYQIQWTIDDKQTMHLCSKYYTSTD